MLNKARNLSGTTGRTRVGGVRSYGPELSWLYK